MMWEMKFKAILFDNDGVLVDTERRYVRASQEVIEEMFGLKLSLGEYQEYGYTKGIGPTGWLREKGFEGEQLVAFQKKRNARYEDFLGEQIDVMVGVRELLAFLEKEKILRAIVTATPRPHLELAHSQTGLLDEFSFAICNGEVPRSKPFPDGYLAAAERLGVDPADCLVLEDSPRGVAAGKAAGATVWAVPTCETRELDFTLADEVVVSLDEVLVKLQASN